MAGVEPLITELISTLNDSSLNCDSKAHGIILNIVSCFKIEQNVSEFELALSLLFRPKNSLLHFIEKAAGNKSFKTSVKDALQCICDPIFYKCTDLLSQYLVPIKEVCYKCLLEKNSSADIKTKAYQVITAIIKGIDVNKPVRAPPDADLKITELVNFLHNRELSTINNSTSQTVVQGIFELYGAIAEAHPNVCVSKINSLIRSILSELKTQIETTSDVKTHRITGCLVALNGILVNFTCRHEESPDKSRQIYSYIKKACDSQNQSRRCFQRAALNLLSRHMDKFWHWALTDHKYWLRLLPNWGIQNNTYDKNARNDCLKAFHKEALKYLETPSQDPLYTELMMTLWHEYKTIFNDPMSTDTQLTLAIKGVGALASSGSHLSNDFASIVFTTVLHWAQNNFNRESGDSSYKQMAECVQSLSHICRGLRPVRNDQLAALLRLAQLSVEFFPQLSTKDIHSSVQNLISAVFNMALCQPPAIDRFLYPLVYQGIIQSCSHTLLEEAELQREVTGLTVITYQNFLPLWKGLLSIQYESTSKITGVTPDLKRNLHKKLYDCLLRALVEMLEKLDVGYTKQLSDQGELVSDPESSLQGTKPQDHRILCNLVNLYKDLMKCLDPNALTKWLPQLIPSLLKRSTSFPLVSAFYKLLAATLQVADSTNYFQDEKEEIQSLGKLVVRFLEDVMFQCQQYKNDLQASCLLVVVSVPVQLIHPLLAGIPTVVKTLMQLGQSYLSLAHSGMDALESWQHGLSPELLRPILQVVLPSFDSYLRSSGILVDSAEEVHLSKKQEQRFKYLADISELSLLQERMLRLLSQIDSATCLSMLRQHAPAVAWSTQPVLTFKLPFPDQRLNVCFDSTLPRVVELAVTSSDRHTKAAACEVLHAFVILFTGISCSKESTHADSLVSLQHHLLPAALSLACGADLVARQLFHPLLLQLAHWYSSLKMLKSPETGAFLEILWNGVTDEGDPSLRDFCAVTFHEFVDWSIRQTSDRDLERSPANIKTVVRQIGTYCKHPVLSKRIGAALVFNHFSKLLRRKSVLVDQFWLELMFHLVKNLEQPGCYNHPVLAALDTCQQGFHEHAQLFHQESKARRVPRDLGSGLMTDVLQWLLIKCGSVNLACAHKCQQMVESLMSLIPGIFTLADLSELEGGVDMVEVCEGGGGTDCSPLPEGHKQRLRGSLDCYCWAYRNNMISDIALTRTPSKLISCITYFIGEIDLSNLRQDDIEVIFAIFDFFSLLGRSINSLPTTIWSNKFWKLVSHCVFSLREGPPDLHKKLCGLLCTLQENLPEGWIGDLCEELSMQSNVDLATCLDRLEHAYHDLGPIDSLYIRGLSILHHSQLLNRVYKDSPWEANTLLTGIYSHLFDDNNAALHPDTTVLSHIKDLLSFAIDLGADIKVTVKNLVDVTAVRDSQTSATVSKGEHLQGLLEDSMLSHLLVDPVHSVSILLQLPSSRHVQITLQLLLMCKYSRNRVNRTRRAEPICEAVLSHWEFLTAVQGTTKALLVELLKAAVQMFPPSSMIGCLSRHSAHSLVPAWILRQLVTDPLDQLADLITLLPSIVVHGQSDSELRTTLRQVEMKFPVLCCELKLGSAERNTFVAVYKSLLLALLNSGSMAILHTVGSAAADPEHVCGDQITSALRHFMKWHSEERQVEALQEIFGKFLDEKSDGETKVRVIESFLLPMLYEACRSAVIKFYTERIQFIIDFLEVDKHLKMNGPIWKVKNLLAWQIGAIQLTEPLFCKLDIKYLEDADNPIVRQAVILENKQLPKCIVSCIFKLRKSENVGNKDLQHLTCKMQCSRYNALSNFLWNTNRSEEMFSKFLFKDKEVWRKIVPTERKYNFLIEFDDYPKMKKAIVKIRGSVKTSESASTVYLPSQSLFNSTLHEDITHFDFSAYQVRDEDRLNQVLNEEQDVTSASLDLEVDDINNHECMATLCVAVTHLSNTYPLVQGENGLVAVLPDWMDGLRLSLISSDQPENCRAFIVRLIVNCQRYFKPVANYWLGPILQTILDNCLGTDLNYLIHDIVAMLCDWSTIAKPTGPQEQSQASEFLRRLVRQTPNDRTDILKYNVEVVKCIVTAWQEFESLPYQELLDLLSKAPETGHLLADVFLSHNILPFNSTGKLSYYGCLLNNIKPEKNQKVYKNCAVVIGKIFKILSKGGFHPLSDEDLHFFKQVQEGITLKDNGRGFISPRNLEQFIICLHSIQENYPAIVKTFVTSCISQLMRMSSIFQAKLVEALTSALNFGFQSDIYSLLHSELPTLLKNQSCSDTQLATLKLVDKLVPSLPVEHMSELLPFVKSLVTHKRHDCRRIVYCIGKWIYDTFEHRTDNIAVSLHKEARSLLLAGLADTDPQLQEELFNFIDGQLSKTVNGRLVDILTKLYSPSHEETFLATIIKLLFQICELTNEFKENMFPDPLSACAFEKYKISSSWRMQHAGFVPRFADTLTSQISSVSQGSFTDIHPPLRATQSPSSSLLVSVPNNDQEELSLFSFGGASTSGAFSGQSYKQGFGFGFDFLSPDNNADDKELSENKLTSKRFSKNKDQLSRKCAERNMAKRAEQEKKQEEKMKQREGQVTVHRNYRKGDFPDVEIPYSEFIKSLQSLAKRDHLFSRLLLVAVCRQLKGEELALSSAVDNILRTSSSCHPVFIASVLELNYINRKFCKTSSSIIADVSKKSHQMTLGALLVEAKIRGGGIYEQLPAKRSRSSTHSPQHQDWIHLAEIYRSMEEKDVVQGLFEEKIAGVCAQSVRSALLLEDQNHWKAALKQYDDCIDKDSSVEHFLDEARFKCFANLSQWRELNNTLKTNKLKNNLDNIWDNDWNSEHSLAWLFLSEIICCQESSFLHLANDFSTAFNHWMEDSARNSHIKEKFGEYLSMVMVVTDEFQRGKLICETTLQNFLKCWQQLDSLAYNLRAHHLLRLGSLMDLHQFLKLPPSSNTVWGNKVKSLLSEWLQFSPSSSDTLVAWETRAAYRNIFATKLEQQANVGNLKKKIRHFQFETRLKTADCAFEQKNVYVTRKYLNNIQEKQLTESMISRWQLAMSRALLMRACLEPDISAKLSRTLSVFDYIKKLRNRHENLGLGNSVCLDLHLHTSDFYNTLLSVLRPNPAVVNTLTQSDRVKLNDHMNGSSNYEDFPAQIEAKVVASLQDAIQASPSASLADSYLRLAHFCFQLEESLYHQRLIESLLRAMKHGSSEARRLFPCLLQLPLLSHQDLFISESAQVAEWMFLGWVNQLLANLNCEWGCVLAPLVLRMAEAYPVALQFPFLLSQEMYTNPATETIVAELRKHLRLDSVTETLVRALACVCQPHLCLIYHIDKLRLALSKDTDQISNAYGLMKLEAFPAEDYDMVKGVAFNIVDKYTKQIEELMGQFLKKKILLEEFNRKLLEIRGDVDTEFKSNDMRDERAKVSQLVSFSPWLVNDYDGEVEVPGQYTGEGRPLSKHHLTITSFNNYAQSLSSLRAPIKVTIMGNDGKNHSFLVKFAEDLRQDQRIQQLFILMSHLLKDSTSGNRRLSVDTYIVAPLNSRLGLIEWVDKTATLHAFIAPSKEQGEIYKEANKIFESWWKSKCNTSDPSVFYSSVRRIESVPSLRKAQSLVQNHTLRHAVLKLAASREAFVHLRSEMLRSHGCMSVCHWLLGVGDRHPSNILVRQDSGRLLGIDFGHAFGTATQLLSVPELVPCRLTSQLVSLATPFNTTGFLKESMVHTLQVMRDNRRVLLAAMTVFIQEPSVDWLKAAHRQQKINNEPLSSSTQWYPEERISEARRKLEGAHPRSIMEKELEGGHRNRPHYQKMLQFLKEAYLDSNMPAENLSSRQQVECLITHSTNEFILSLTYYGWMPWV